MRNFGMNCALHLSMQLPPALQSRPKNEPISSVPAWNDRRMDSLPMHTFLRTGSPFAGIHHEDHDRPSM
jgi:hypothetical protein